MGTTSLTTTATTTALTRQRQELQAKLDMLLQAYTFAQDELDKRSKPSTTWAQTAAEAANSDGSWIASSLQPQFTQWVDAEEKRWKEVEALQYFLVSVPHQIRSLTQGLEQLAIDAVEAEKGRLQLRVDHSVQLKKEAEARIVKNEELRKIVAAGRLEAIPRRLDASTKHTEALEALQQELASLKSWRLEPGEDMTRFLSQLREEGRQLTDYMASLLGEIQNARIREATAAAAAAASPAPSRDSTASAPVSAEPMTEKSDKKKS